MLALMALAWVTEKTSPGMVMRPVRTIAAKVGIEILPRTLTDEERSIAREMARRWKAACLERHPILAITPRSVPDDENGFLMLWELGQGDGVSQEFQDMLRDLKNFDSDAARRHLEEHQEFIAHIERIANTLSRSSMNMPDAYNGFIGIRHVKQAFDTLMLQACLAAEAGDEKEALGRIHLAGNLAEHLSAIETPHLLSETGVVLFDISRHATTINFLLPKLGPGANLDAWQTELNRFGGYTPQRYADLLRGEWHTGADHVAFQWIAQASLTGELRNGKACAMAYSDRLTYQIAKFKNLLTWRGVDFKIPESDFSHLSREQQQLMSILAIGFDAWGEGFIRSALVIAKYRAAMDLLILERDGNEPSPDDTARITIDPISGEPFVFDPETRTLTAPEASQEILLEALELPW